MSPRRRARLLLVSGLLLALVGGAVLVRARSSEIGWFAYAPLSDEAFIPASQLHPAHYWGAAVVVVGLVAAGWASGYLVGRRNGPDRDGKTRPS